MKIHTKGVIVSILLVLVIVFGAYQFNQSSDSVLETATDVSTTTPPSATSSAAAENTAPKPSVPPVKPATSRPQASSSPSTSNTLVKIEYRGGFCPNGNLCRVTKVITKDAVYYKDGVRISNVNKNDVSRLSVEIGRTDWNALKSKPKTTGCDLERVQEITYTFYTTSGIQVISTCQHDFDVAQPPFRTIAILLPQ